MPDTAPPLFRLLTVGLLLCAACTRPNPAYRPRLADADAGPPSADAGPSSPDAGPPSPDAGPPSPDAGPPTDGTADLDPADAPLAATDSAPACGSARPDITGIGAADGLAFDADGTLYFTNNDGTHGWVGRMLTGQAPQAQWLRLDFAPVIRGLALDGGRSQLYVASVSGAAIVAFGIGQAVISGRVLLGNLDGLNDLALDRDGNVYYSLQSDRHVYRVDPQGTNTRVSKTPLGETVDNQAPAALAFAPDGSLFVGLKNGGAIVRLVLDAGVEQSRAAFGPFEGWANGLAFDSSGRLYVGLYHDTLDRDLVRLDADGSNPSVSIAGGSFSGLAFGRGPLDCHDLYAADPRGPLRRLTTDTPGPPPP